MLLQNTLLDGIQRRQTMQESQSLHSHFSQAKDDGFGQSLDAAWQHKGIFRLWVIVVLNIGLLKMSEIGYFPSLPLFRISCLLSQSNLALRPQPNTLLSAFLPSSAIDPASCKEKIKPLRIHGHSLGLGHFRISNVGHYLHECILNRRVTTCSRLRLISSMSGKRSKI